MFALPPDMHPRFRDDAMLAGSIAHFKMKKAPG
jgi:hypothetical protein